MWFWPLMAALVIADIVMAAKTRGKGEKKWETG